MSILINIEHKKEVVVVEVTSQYKQLMSCGIFKGTKVKVIRNDQWQGIMLLEVDKKRIAIRKEDARFIKVQELNGGK